MRRFIIFMVLITAILVFDVVASNYSGNIKDDLNASNIPTLYDENISSPPQDVFKNFNKSNKNTAGKTSNIGITTYKDLNLSNTKEIKNLIDSLKRNAAATANGIIKNMSKHDPQTAKYTTKDLKELTIDRLKATTTNQKKLISYQDTQDTVTKLLNIFGGKNTIKCYIKRRLVPNFFCPMSGKNNSYFTGGLANTANEKAKKECNEYCQIKQSCLSMNINGFTNANPVTVINKMVPVNKNIPLSDKQQVNSTEIILESSIDKVHVSINVLAQTNNKKDSYVPSFWEQHNRCFDLSKIKNFCTDSLQQGVAEVDKTGCPSGYGKVKCVYRGYVDVVRNYDVELAKGQNAIKIPMTLKNNPSYKVDILTPYVFALTKRKSTMKPNSVKLISIKTHYDDNKLWFCPAHHFINSAKECFNGEIHDLIIGGSPELVCSRKSDLLRESLYGGYYSEKACNAGCFEKMECQPTYKGLSSGVSSSIYNVDYGCMSGQDNSSCTKQLCKDKIFTNTMPNTEKVYYNNAKEEITVLNKQTISGKARPVYNISAEMSSNNDPVAKKKLMASTAKDMAYRNMMANNTYVISANILSKRYPLQTKATRINVSGVSIEYVPRSDLFNINKNAYVYIITANKYHYTEKDLFTNTSGIYGSSSFKSINYTIMDSSRNLKLFYLNDKAEVLDNNNTYEPYVSAKTIKKTVDTGTGDLVAYDLNDYAPVYKTYKFFSDQYRFNVKIANNYFEYAKSQNGTFLTRQESSNGTVIKKYSGSISNQTGGTIDNFDVYMATSDTKLTYKDIIDKIKNKTLHKAYSYSFYSDYTKDIPGDASVKFNNKNIKIFVLGKVNNMSLVGEYKPSFDEEGKEAFVFNFLYSEK